MRQKSKMEIGHAVGKWRKELVGTVFGQVKEGRGFRRFAFRGLTKVGA